MTFAHQGSPVWMTAVLCAVITGFALCSPERAAGQSAAAPVEEPRSGDAGGIWKAAVPPRPMTAAFGGLDPVGVAAGAKIQADCSLNWIDPDDGTRYCFASGTSLQYFLERPHVMIERARSGWRAFTSR